MQDKYKRYMLRKLFYVRLTMDYNNHNNIAMGTWICKNCLLNDREHLSMAFGSSTYELTRKSLTFTLCFMGAAITY